MDELLHFFRQEAREITSSLTSQLLALEKNPADPEPLKQCLRSAHTLKGTARVVRQVQIGEMAHMLEDALAPLRDGGEVESEYISDLLRIVDRIQEMVGALDQDTSAEDQTGPQAPGNAPKPSADGDALETVRVGISEMDGLLEGLSEAAIQIGPLHEAEDTVRQAALVASSLQELLRNGSSLDQTHMLGRARAAADELCTALAHIERTMSPSLSRLEREVESVRSRASTLRLLPVSAILGTLELAVRDTAQTLGKAVNFVASGSDVKLEGHILLSVRDALLHMIRNAVDHGIEGDEQRFDAGKPLAGEIQLAVMRQGRRVIFECRDDGRGIDIDNVRRTAIKNGRLTHAQAAALTRDEALGLLFEAGVSTAKEVTEISGRGVGLDVVQSVAKRLRGKATISSEVGRGTVITIDVPVSLSAMSVLAVEVDETTVLIPIDAVRKTLLLNRKDIAKRSDGDHIIHEERAISFVPLGSIMGTSQASTDSRNTWTVVVVQSASKWFALGADRLRAAMDVVVKPLPSGIDASAVIAGAAFDSQGDPLLVLDPMALDGTSTAVTRMADASVTTQARRLPILVIDDSLTTRMLEQSILEAAGYTVDLCASADEAIRKAQTRNYGLFICDVEMPGMNGFEFTAATRADPKLCTIPVIMVTSLATPENRKRGMDAGASDYIVKGDFDQKHFVLKVAELLGAA